jgi:hypothetical protein
VLDDQAAGYSQQQQKFPPKTFKTGSVMPLSPPPQPPFQRLLETFSLGQSCLCIKLTINLYVGRKLSGAILHFPIRLRRGAYLRTGMTFFIFFDVHKKQTA